MDRLETNWKKLTEKGSEQEALDLNPLSTQPLDRQDGGIVTWMEHNSAVALFGILMITYRVQSQGR